MTNASLILNPAASAANGNSPVYDVCPVGSDKPVGQIALGADDLWRIVGTDGAPSQHAVDLISRLLSDDTTPDEPGSNLVGHARRELALVETDAELTECLVAAVKAFAAYGHSGGSAAVGADYLARLIRFEPLSPIGTTPGEWVEVAEDLWQNTRHSAMFSQNAGATWWHVDHPGELYCSHGFRQLAEHAIDQLDNLTHPSK